MPAYYAAIKSGSPVSEATVHTSRDCNALQNADLSARPISEGLVESTDPGWCGECVGNSSDSQSGGGTDASEDVSDSERVWLAANFESPEEAIQMGVCPWCPAEDEGRYEGEHVGQHASSAHPAKWDDYTEDGD